MSKFLDKPASDTLYRAIVLLQTEEECRNFLQDLCTVSELKAMEQRMEVAMLLDDGLIYSDILERTGAPPAPPSAGSTAVFITARRATIPSSPV